MGTGWREDGTSPRPPGPRSLAELTAGVDELRGRAERVLYVAGLLDEGAFDVHGEALVLGLATSWGTRAFYVRRMMQQALAEQARSSGADLLVGQLAAELDRVRRKATRDGGYAAAVQAIMGKAKLFGLVATGAEPKRPNAPDPSKPPPWLRPVKREGEP